MNSQLISFLNLFGLDSAELLLEQREQEEPRMPFEMERELLAFVREGKPDEMLLHYAKPRLLQLA
ncbi:MAG: hypothetical protein LBK67_08750 [Coriobacteriales bacterium]|jgi:hypothetical protein|nr:hypothetical protein [Coriobacteriales bacterium]